jgi:hypothetical protein
MPVQYRSTQFALLRHVVSNRAAPSSKRQGRGSLAERLLMLAAIAFN